MAQMESETLKKLTSILMSDARHEIAKLEMPEESWDNLVAIIDIFERKLNEIYKAFNGD